MTRLTMDPLELEHKDTKVVVFRMNIGHITHLRGATLMETSSW